MVACLPSASTANKIALAQENSYRVIGQVPDGLGKNAGKKICK
jgi:hypothetical protein